MPKTASNTILSVNLMCGEGRRGREREREGGRSEGVGRGGEGRGWRERWEEEYEVTFDDDILIG